MKDRRQKTTLWCTACLVGSSIAAQATAGIVDVAVRGVVESNQVTSGGLAPALPNDPVLLTFQIDSSIFTDSVTFPTRGYPIDPSSFTMTLGSATVALASPFPAGQTPYFVLRDNDPAVDGFWVATSIDFPIGVPLDETGGFGDFENNYSVTYGGSTLASLDILSALGFYDFTGLTVFNWTIDDGPFNPIIIDFEDMTISRGAGPVPTLPEWGMIAMTAIMALMGVFALRRRMVLNNVTRV